MFLHRRDPNLNIAVKTGALGVRLAITPLEQYGWASILRTCNLSGLAVPLYSAFDIPALFCPLRAVPHCSAVSSLDDFIVPGQLPPGLLPPCGRKRTLCHYLAPSSSLALLVSPPHRLRQAFLSEQQHAEFPIASLLFLK